MKSANETMETVDLRGQVEERVVLEFPGMLLRAVSAMR